MKFFCQCVCLVFAVCLLLESYDASEVYHDSCTFDDFNSSSLNARSSSSCCEFQAHHHVYNVHACIYCCYSFDTAILSDLPESIVVYQNQPTDLCVLATNGCTDGKLLWNGVDLYHDRSIGREEYENYTVIISYHLMPEDVSANQNGSTVQFELAHPLIRSSMSVLLIYGK